MSSEQEPATSFLKSSVGSRSTDLQLAHAYADSPWIRRFHLSASPPSPPPAPPGQSASITVRRRNTISTYESRAPLNFPQRDREEPGEAISGFGPYQFKATNRLISEQFPPVARIARFSCEKRIMDRRKGFKLSPFFQLWPPLPGARFTVKNPVKAGEADFHGDASEASSPKISVELPPQAPNSTNQEEKLFSNWNLGRINSNNTISSSFANVPSLENYPRKMSKKWG